MEWVHYFQIARAYFHDLLRHTSLILRSITYCLSNDILSQIIIHLTLEKTQSHNEENSILIWRIMENLQVSLKRETLAEICQKIARILSQRHSIVVVHQ